MNKCLREGKLEVIVLADMKQNLRIVRELQVKKLRKFHHNTLHMSCKKLNIVNMNGVLVTRSMIKSTKYTSSISL